ncbi:MAG: ornithine cyclodeaminase family protein [Chloroflexi bacterium]|nr:ornithine cyclodeaminase family protein [Chloroflexota bacterium]
MEDSISAVEDSLNQLALGKSVNRPRGHDIAGPGAYLAHMRAAAYGQGVSGFKTYTACAGSFRFHVYLFSTETGQLLTVIEANRLGQLRTGAATAVSVRHMARSDSSTVGLLGTGFQASTQLEAVCKVRPISEVKVYSPTAEHRVAFASRMTETLDVKVTPVDSPREAVEAADILITVTASRTPVFDGGWLRPGTHVAAVGGANEYVRELDDECVQRADLLVVDGLAQAKIECGELLMPASRGLIMWEQVRELWQIVSGAVPGRSLDDDVTIFKSLGMALWDIAVAKVVYDKAVARGVGVTMGN